MCVHSVCSARFVLIGRLNQRVYSVYMYLNSKERSHGHVQGEAGIQACITM
jgi:hypothetical protein